jgi:hypothetical protein
MPQLHNGLNESNKFTHLMDGSTFLESGLIITSEIAGGDTVEDDTLK